MNQTIKKTYALGIDIGSTTVKYVLCDTHFKIVAKAYTPHDTKQADTLLRLLEELSQTNKELALEVDNRDKALQQERNLTQIIEKSLNEIYLFDADSYRFLFVNEGARINTGYSQAEFLNMTPIQIKPEIDLSSFEKIVEGIEKFCARVSTKASFRLLKMCSTVIKELSLKCSMICCALVPLPEANIASLIIIDH